MRAGYATAAAAADVPDYRIQQHTRHKSVEMVARYVREADKWTKSGLKGVGFRGQQAPCILSSAAPQRRTGRST